MALRGNLIDFSLPDVFQLVTLSGKTGVLRIKRADAEGSVWFRDGEVFFAQSDWHAEPLGTRLVAAGRVTPSALGRALEVQKAEPPGGRRLGAILIAEGYITDKVLEAFVQEQIQDTIFDLFRWDEGDFDFEPLDAAPAEDIGLSVSIENIVMEGSRRLEEWNRIKKKIPSMEIVFKMATAPGEGTFDISLKPTEWNLLLKVDGTRAVAELARELGRTDFEVARVIYGLFSAGLLEVASDEEVERLRAERLEWEAKFAKDNEKARETEDREKLEVLEREARLVADAQERERAGRRSAVEAAAHAVAIEAEVPLSSPAPEPPAADHIVEEPAFLSAETPTPDDMAVFEQMIGAVLEVPEVPEAPSELAAEVEATERGAEEFREPFAPAEAPSDLLEVEAPVEQPVPAPHPVYEIIEEPVDEAEPEAAVEPETLPEPEREAVPEPEPEPAAVPEWETFPEPEVPSAPPLEAFEPESMAEVAPAEEPADAVAAEAGLPLEDATAGVAAFESTPFAEPEEPPVAMPFETALEVERANPPYVSDAEIFGGAGDAPVEGAQELTDLLEALGQSAEEVPVAAFRQAGDKPAITGDYATDLMALGLGEMPAAEPVEEPSDDLADLLTTLGDEEQPVVLGTSSVIGEDEDLLTGEEPASGVISTDAFLADFDTSDVSFSSGLLGDELTALTGGGAAPKRPQATAKKLPEEGDHVLRRDQHVDRALMEKIIEGVQKL